MTVGKPSEIRAYRKSLKIKSVEDITKEDNKDRFILDPDIIRSLDMDKHKMKLLLKIDEPGRTFRLD